MLLQTAAGPPTPSGVMVDGVDNTSVRVSWQTVDDVDRYNVTFIKKPGNNQQRLCITDIHIACVSVDAPSTSASISVGQMLAQYDTTMLRAYTTYSITVVAESDLRGSSEDSEPVTVITPQTSKYVESYIFYVIAVIGLYTCIYVIRYHYCYRCYRSSSQYHGYSYELHCHHCPMGWPGTL